MKTINNISNLPQGEDSPNTPFSVNGWEINTFPPQITQKGGYTQSPTPLVKIDTGTVAAEAIPVSKVTASDKQNVFHGYVGINSDPNCTYGNNGKQYWEVKGGAQLWVMVHSPMSVNVNLILNMSVKNVWHPSTHIDIWINDQAYSCNPSSAQNSTNIDWQNLVLPITSNMLKGQGTQNIIKLMPDDSGANIRSVTLEASSAITTASYYWERLAGNIATMETAQHYSRGVASGVTNTNAELQAFAAEMSVTGSDKIQPDLSEITASLDASFKVTHSSENSVNLTTESTEKWGVKFEVSAPDESLTYEIWQLVMQYEVNGKLLNIPTELGDAPIFIRTLKSQ